MTNVAAIHRMERYGAGSIISTDHQALNPNRFGQHNYFNFLSHNRFIKFRRSSGTWPVYLTFVP